MITKVVNRYKDKFDIYIGRGSMWGNPFPITNGGDDRATVIQKYRNYFWNRYRDGLIKDSDILSLEGHILGCYCKPQPCHGDVLVEAIDVVRGVLKPISKALEGDVTIGTPVQSLNTGNSGVVTMVVQTATPDRCTGSTEFYSIDWSNGTTSAQYKPYLDLVVYR